MTVTAAAAYVAACAVHLKNVNVQPSQGRLFFKPDFRCERNLLKERKNRQEIAAVPLLFFFSVQACTNMLLKEKENIRF